MKANKMCFIFFWANFIFLEAIRIYVRKIWILKLKHVISIWNHIFFECCENVNFFELCENVNFSFHFFIGFREKRVFLNNKTTLRRTRNRLVHIRNTNKFQKSENYHYYQIIIIIIKLSVIITWSAW